MGKRKLNTPEMRARVGERIKVAATQSGFSLKELAEHVGVSASAIYQYVRGITALSPTLLERIAVVTGVHISFFDPELDARQTLALPLEGQGQEPQAATPGQEAMTRSRIEAEYRQARALAEAHCGRRPNRVALLSALERMLALCRALEYREQYAAILAQIGQARLADGHHYAARESLAEALELLGEEQTALRSSVTLDLARCCCELEEHAEAAKYLNEICVVEDSSARWQAELLLGRMRFRFGDYAGALSRYGQAAEAVMAQSSAQLERDAQIPLAVAVAQLAYGTGHFEAARALWEHAGRQAERIGDAAAYLEIRTELARCEEARGNLSAARGCLENVLVLTAFLPDVENRQVVARGLLARIQAEVGAHEAARENARQALRTAHRSGMSADSIAACIALAQIRLAGEQYAEALEYAGEALDVARRTDRAADAAAAHLVRARAFFGGHSAQRGANSPAAEAAIRRALIEAKAAAEAAERGREQVIRLEAQWVVADLYAAIGANVEAEAAVNQFLEMVATGPFSLRGLLNTGTNSLLGLLSSEMDLPSLFHLGVRLDLPLIEWQVHTLRGVLASDAGQMDAAYASFLQGAQIVWRILSGLTPNEAYAFQLRNRRLPVLLEGLERSSSQMGAQADVRTILDRILLATEQSGTAVVGVNSASEVRAGTR